MNDLLYQWVAQMLSFVAFLWLFVRFVNRRTFREARVPIHTGDVRSSHRR